MGSLDYAARTLIGHGARQREAAEQVVNHLVSQIFALHGVANEHLSEEQSGKPTYNDALDRLEVITDRLEAALLRASRRNSHSVQSKT